MALLVALATTSLPARTQGDPVLDAIARKRDARQWLEALQLIDEARARAPADQTLYRLQALTLADNGNLYQAWRLYIRHPEWFKPVERERLESGKHAREIVWSQVPGKDEASDLDEARAAKREVDGYLAREDISPETRLRMRMDRLLLLDRLRDYPALAREYESLVAEGHALPGYVMAAVGNAYLALKQPERAEAMYRQALAHDPGNHELVIQHAYSLVEGDRLAQALDRLWRLREAQPAWLNQPGSRIYSENWKRYAAEDAYYMVRSYGEELRMAGEAYAGMAGIGATNSGVQEALGSVYLRRGWDSQALERFRMAETLDERDFQARIGQVDALMNLQRHDLARPIHDTLREQRGGNTHVEMLAQRYRANRGWEVETHYGNGRNRPDRGDAVSPVGNRDGQVGISIASPLLDDRWRLVAGSTHRWADYPDGRSADRRVYFGVRYAFDRLWTQLALGHANDGIGGVGIVWDGSWRFSDTFDGRLRLARNDDQLGLQARKAGIHADSARLGFDWAPSDLGQLSASLQRWRYSDGNRRDALQINGIRRLLTRPHWRIDGKVGYYASRGEPMDTAYFNPERDHMASVGLRINHLVWRRYERSFRHTLDIDAGPYRQQGFSSYWVLSVSYRHEWKPAGGWTLGYGFGWSRPVYDGRRETRRSFDLYLRWGSQ
ncbi:tetratricopeptide repeat protein [Solilutibacter pythonis]|nr:tetratricopeptide repeat protein [Lysobacter pythonis]